MLSTLAPLPLELPICQPTSHSQRVPLVLCLLCGDENREVAAPAELLTPALLTVKVLPKVDAAAQVICGAREILTD